MTFPCILILEGVAAPLDAPNVDTGLILPARYLRRPRSRGYQDFLFRDLRFDKDGAERPNFVLNQTPFRNARILIAAGTFGSGSSREQAPWGLLDYGFRCVIAESFGDTFYANACNTGILPVQLGSMTCDRLREQLHAAPGAAVRVDLPRQEVTGPDGTVYAFSIDAFRKRRLLEGLDDIGLTLLNESAVAAFESEYRRRFPWLFSQPA
jgi:3-isopropylmalate/(R)-2-methylmalate dehydratase small subunit